MATMKSVIVELEEVKPNVIPDEIKYKWLATLDGRISIEVFGEKEAKTYALPDDADTELLVKAPHDDIYVLYCSAMVDFYNREYENYNNAVMIFQQSMDALKTWYIQNNRLSKARNFRNVMG